MRLVELPDDAHRGGILTHGNFLVVTSNPTPMAFLSIPNGVPMRRWRPGREGRDYQLGPTLNPLAPFKDKFQLITGLELSCETMRKSGGCDSGYSCAYQFNMSWRNDRQPVGAESNPRYVFERLFGAGKGAERAAHVASRQQQRRSILDFVAAEAKDLERSLATADRRKLEEYLTALREIERQLALFDKPVPGVPDIDLPEHAPPTYSEHIHLMADMPVLAFQTDSTRIATFMLAHDGGNRTFPAIGVGDGHHHLSHHQNNEEMLEKIDRFYAEQFCLHSGPPAGCQGGRRSKPARRASGVSSPCEDTFAIPAPAIHVGWMRLSGVSRKDR